MMSPHTRYRKNSFLSLPSSPSKLLLCLGSIIVSVQSALLSVDSLLLYIIPYNQSFHASLWFHSSCIASGSAVKAFPWVASSLKRDLSLTVR